MSEPTAGEPSAPEAPADAGPPPAREITLEEWIASTQACCGLDPAD